MPEKNPASQSNPLNELWQELAAGEAKEIAKRSGASQEGTNLRLSAIGQNLIIDRQNRIVQTAGKESVPFLLQLVLLQYLLKAQDLPLAGKLVSPLEFVGGDFFFRGPHAFELRQLEEKFGRNQEGFLQAGIQLGGHPQQHSADASFTLPALPRIPLTYALWRADEEFPAKINVLFDASAEHQLPLDMLWALVNLTSKQLLGAP